MNIKNRDTVSIIIPVYNVSEYINDCLESIVTQSYKDLQIILVDDGSTDGSSSICDDYAARDSRIVVIHQENQGVSSARNNGIKIAKGGYIAFVDSDDTVQSNYIETMKSHMDTTDSEIIKCSIAPFFDSSEVVNINKDIRSFNIKEPKKDILDVLYCKGIGRWSGPGAKLYKKSLLDGLLFDTSMAYDEDFEFLYRAIARANSIGVIDFNGYMYRERPGSATQSGFKPKMLESIEKRLRTIDDDKEIARAQRTNIALNSIHKISLIPDNTKRYSNEREQLWEIIKSLRFKAVLDPRQRIDHKASTIASYFGKTALTRVVRRFKRIRLASED